MMKNIAIYLTLLFLFIISCKRQDKDVKINDTQTAEIYFAKCQEYTTGEKISERDKNWSLKKKDIDEIMKLSSEITENEWHFSYPVTPCNIDIKGYYYNGKKYDIQINGGSYLFIYDGEKTIISGCDLPDCRKYFLRSKENMSEEEDTLSSQDSKPMVVKKYDIDFNKNNIQDILLVEKKATGFILTGKIDNNFFLTKLLNVILYK